MDALTQDHRRTELRAAPARGARPPAARGPANPGAGEIRGRVPARRRLWFGDAHVEYRDFPAQKPVQLRMGAANIVLVVALAGQIDIVCASGGGIARPGAAVLLARNEPVTLVGQAGARELCLHLSRRELHRMASAAFGGGRRVSTAEPWALTIHPGGALAQAIAKLEDLLRDDEADLGPEAKALAGRLNAAVLDSLSRAGPIEDVLPPSRAVTEAMRRIEQRPHEPWDLPSLAAAVGVTPKSLQRSFHDHLGKGVTTFILEARLQRARTSLASARDSRPMAAIAARLGFQKPGSFTRAYLRLFGETPTQTRARAVRGQGSGDGETR